MIVALLGGAGRAAAAPLDEPFIGGMSFDGPTSGNLAAVYWNPAALGLVRGFQLMVSGSGRLSTVNVNRAPIDPTTGMPGGTTTFPSAQARDLTWPSPLGPNSFFALSTDFGGDRFTIAFATYMPYLQRITFPVSTSGNEPTRYQMLALDLRNLLLAPALSIRFGNDFRVGFAPGFLFSTGRLMFAEDLALDGGSAGLNSDCMPGVPCGAENPRAAARYDVSSGNDIGDAKFSVTLGAGIYYRRRSFELGVAYQSRPLGSDVPGVEVAGQHTTVTLPPRDPMGGGSALNCPKASRAAASSATSPTGFPTSGSRGRPGGSRLGWNCRRWCAGCGCRCTTRSTSACRAPRSTGTGTTPPAHRAVARIQGCLGHAGARLVLVARAGPRRRDVARRDQRGRHRRGQRRRGRRLEGRARRAD